MRLLFLASLVAVATAGYHHAYNDDVLVPYVLNPGGIGGIYKGPDSATIIRGPDGGVIKSKQIGGAVVVDDVAPAVVVPVAKPVVGLHTGVSAGAIYAGPVSSGAVLVDRTAPGHIDVVPHDLTLNGGAIHAGPTSAGSIHVGPSSAGSIHAGPVSSGAVLVDRTAPGHIDVVPHDLTLTAGPTSAGSIHVGPSSSGSIHVGPTGLAPAPIIPLAPLSAPALIHSGPVVLRKDPIIVPEVVVARDPKIVEEAVVVGHKVISVPKKVEEDTDLVGPSGTISTRGGDAVISGPASITIKGDGVVTDIAKQPDVQLKTVEIKPVVAPVVTKVASPVLAPAVHPIVEGAGTIITHRKPVLPLLTSVDHLALGAPLVANPLNLPIDSLHLPHYAPAYVQRAHVY